MGITGASGAIYGYTMLRTLVDMGIETHLVITKMGEQVLRYECGLSREQLHEYGKWHSIDNMFAPIASGSFKTQGMVIMPCSMNSLGAIANGTGETLLSRAASVAMKERRKFIVVTRETPLHLIHIENMARLARAGATIMPACPGFYHKPKEIWELTNFMVGRVLDALDIEHDLLTRWGESLDEEPTKAPGEKR